MGDQCRVVMMRIHGWQRLSMYLWVMVVIFLALYDAIGVRQLYGSEPEDDMGYLANLAERALSQELSSRERLDAIGGLVRLKESKLSIRPLNISDIVVANGASKLASGLIFQHMAKADPGDLEGLAELIEAHTRSGQYDTDTLRELLVRDMDYTPQEPIDSPYRMFLDMVHQKRPDIDDRLDRGIGRTTVDVLMHQLLLASPPPSTWSEAFSYKKMDPLKLVVEVFDVRRLELAARFAIAYKEVMRMPESERLAAYRKLVKHVAESVVGDDRVVFGDLNTESELMSVARHITGLTSDSIVREGKEVLKSSRIRSLLYRNPNAAQSILFGDNKPSVDPEIRVRIETPTEYSADPNGYYTIIYKTNALITGRTISVVNAGQWVPIRGIKALGGELLVSYGKKDQIVTPWVYVKQVKNWVVNLPKEASVEFKPESIIPVRFELDERLRLSNFKELGVYHQKDSGLPLLLAELPVDYQQEDSKFICEVKISPGQYHLRILGENDTRGQYLGELAISAIPEHIYSIKFPGSLVSD